MLTLRKANDRFHTQIDWLDSWHSFSFGEHHDARHMGFGPLRVINDDRIRGGAGFPTHPHRDMEIITVVLSGALSHKDSLGTGSTILPGDVQKMSAGSGIRHSEFNASATEAAHLLQIWIMPNKAVEPSYEQVHFEPEQLRDQFLLVAGDKAAPITINQDARMYVGNLSKGKVLDFKADTGRNLWVQLATGSVDVAGQKMQAGDGLAATGERSLSFSAKEDSKVLVFDLGA